MPALVRPPEAVALALKKLLTQPEAQEGWWEPVLTGVQPCPAWPFASPSVPMGPRCLHTDSPTQPLLRCGCHPPFSRGGADFHPAGVHQRAIASFFGKCSSVSPETVHGTRSVGTRGWCWPRYCTLAPQPETPVRHRASTEPSTCLQGTAAQAEGHLQEA